MTNPRCDTELIADLNDLLQLDHDATLTYTVAIDTLRDEAIRTALVGFRADHKRHSEDLSRVIRELGGMPIELPHISTSPMKLVMQAAASAGGDVSILLAFKANEGQVRERYRKMAGRELPPTVASLLSRNAGDEERHYRWAERTLNELGHGGGTAASELERVVEDTSRVVLNKVERVDRAVGKIAEELRRDFR